MIFLVITETRALLRNASVSPFLPSLSTPIQPLALAPLRQNPPALCAPPRKKNRSAPSPFFRSPAKSSGLLAIKSPRSRAFSDSRLPVLSAPVPPTVRPCHHLAGVSTR